MTPIPADDPLQALTDAIERAEKEVFRLCSGRDRSFRMTVPPEPDRDSDLLLIAGLDAGREALRRLAALQQPAHPEPRVVAHQEAATMGDIEPLSPDEHTFRSADGRVHCRCGMRAVEREWSKYQAAGASAQSEGEVPPSSTSAALRAARQQPAHPDDDLPAAAEAYMAHVREAGCDHPGAGGGTHTGCFAALRLQAALHSGDTGS